MQHFVIHPLSLPITSWMRNRGKGDLASKALDVLHVGAARELGAVISNDPCRDSEATHQFFQELDS